MVSGPHNSQLVAFPIRNAGLLQKRFEIVRPELLWNVGDDDPKLAIRTDVLFPENLVVADPVALEGKAALRGTAAERALICADACIRNLYFCEPALAEAPRLDALEEVRQRDAPELAAPLERVGLYSPERTGEVDSFERALLKDPVVRPPALARPAVVHRVSEIMRVFNVHFVLGRQPNALKEQGLPQTFSRERCWLYLF